MKISDRCSCSSSRTRHRETRPQSSLAEFLRQQCGQAPREYGAELRVFAASCHLDTLAEIERRDGTWVRLLGWAWRDVSGRERRSVMSSDERQPVDYKTHMLIGVRPNGIMTVIADWPYVPRQAEVQ